MGQFTANMILIVFTIIFGIYQCNDDCFYHPGHAGKKCFDGHHKYTCCPPDHHCIEGKCNALGSGSPSKTPVHTYVLIGVGIVVAAIVCIIIIGAIFWHRKQMRTTEKPFNPLAAFVKNTNSVGYRKGASKTQATHSVSSVNINMPPTMTN